MSWLQRVGVLVVDLQPEQVERLKRPADGDGALGLEVVVDIQADVDVGADGLAHRSDLLDCVPDQVGRSVLVVRASEHVVDDRWVLARKDDVGLERGVACVHGLAGAVGDVLHRAQLGDAPLLGHPRPVGGEVRPVHPLLVPERAADQPVHGHAVELALDVPQGKLDTGDGHCCRSAGRRARVTVHVHPELVDRERDLANQRLADVLDERGQALGE